jgi:hypothetical protein
MDASEEMFADSRTGFSSSAATIITTVLPFRPALPNSSSFPVSLAIPNNDGDSDDHDDNDSDNDSGDKDLTKKELKERFRGLASLQHPTEVRVKVHFQTNIQRAEDSKVREPVTFGGGSAWSWRALRKKLDLLRPFKGPSTAWELGAFAYTHLHFFIDHDPGDLCWDITTGQAAFRPNYRLTDQAYGEFARELLDEAEERSEALAAGEVVDRVVNGTVWVVFDFPYDRRKGGRI